MATYQELFAIANDTPKPLAEKIRVALVIKARAIAVDGASTAAQNDWAMSALRNPSQDAHAALQYILATYKALTPAQITGAADVDVQTAVDATVDQLLGV